MKFNKKNNKTTISEFYDNSEIDQKLINVFGASLDIGEFEFNHYARTEKMENMFLDIFSVFDIVRWKKEFFTKPFIKMDSCYYLSKLLLKYNDMSDLLDLISYFKNSIKDMDNSIIITRLEDLTSNKDDYMFYVKLLKELNFKTIGDFCKNEQGEVYIYLNNIGNEIYKEIQEIMSNIEEAISDYNLFDTCTLNYICINGIKIIFYDGKKICMYNQFKNLIKEFYSNHEPIDIGVEILDIKYDKCTDIKNIINSINIFLELMKEEYGEDTFLYTDTIPVFKDKEIFYPLNIEGICNGYQIGNYGTVIDSNDKEILKTFCNDAILVPLTKTNGIIEHFPINDLLKNTFGNNSEYDNIYKDADYYQNLGFKQIEKSKLFYTKHPLVVN